MFSRFDTIKSRRTLWPDFRAGLLLRGDDGGGTAGGGSRAEAEAVGN